MRERERERERGREKERERGRENLQLQRQKVCSSIQPSRVLACMYEVYKETGQNFGEPLEKRSFHSAKVCTDLQARY